VAFLRVFEYVWCVVEVSIVVVLFCFSSGGGENEYFGESEMFFELILAYTVVVKIKLELVHLWIERFLVRMSL
jgi:hypothetical protein